MTSNLGAELLIDDPNNKKGVIDLIKTYFKPEFLNRIDEIIVFNPLTKDIQTKIVNKMLHELDIRLISQDIHITYTDSLKQYVLNQAFDISYGARPLKRFIQKYIETYIAEQIIKSNIIPEKEYVLDSQNGELRLYNK